MIASLALILTCQLVGEVLARLAGLTIPGPVIGLLIFTGLLFAIPALMERVEQVATALLAHLSLLFVPAAVGVIQHLDRLSSAFLPIIASLLVSTLATLVVSALVFRWVARLMDRRTGEKADG
ncbi:MAG: CidA/LrgA family protein [Hyphomicrobiaceae bacterium]|nr:CidA/LrgA family protein [Hyphomicrobiaceae bacterium]